MQRRFIASAVLLVSAALAFPNKANAATVDDATRTSAVTVTSAKTFTQALGAGVVIDLDGTTATILTAKHVAVFGSHDSIAIDATHSAEATVLYADPAHDLAVLRSTVPAAMAQTLRAVPMGEPRAHEQLHLWGQFDGSLEEQRGDVAITGTQLPDGPAQGRFALSCDRCHQGDSGAGVFAEDGRLVGIYLGYYMEDGRQGLSVASLPGFMVGYVKTAAPPVTVALTTIAAPALATQAQAISAAPVVGAADATDETTTIFAH